jgi:hypothetical protein
MVEVKFSTDEWWPFYHKIPSEFENSTLVELEIKIDEEDWQKYEEALNTVINFQRFLHDEADKR